ncbi:alpha/beta hydrolase family protein [Metallibacterium scheffleri]|uniref:Peptidase S9 n=2 Tax=root TaxID=1 RepID=A0A4S3KKH3_9GAMM|nr:S9 family peptidase [Metallibacterium scheffleri]THD09246.1 peptidase S9 [Metallibacterium scheffleri]
MSLRSLALGLVLMSTSMPVIAAPDDDTHPMDVRDMVAMDRVGDPRLGADPRWLLFDVRSIDLAANKGVSGVWVLDLEAQDAAPQRLTEGSQPRWSADGKSIFYLAKAGERMQVFRIAPGGGAATQVTDLQLDVDGFRVSPDGTHLAIALGVFPDCNGDIACTRAKLNVREADKASGRVYDRLFVRHWDTWADGRRNQLFLLALGADGKAAGTPTLLTRGIDGDVPSKPFGDDSEYVFSPDGKTLYFNARIARHDEPWSTNFDIYRVAIEGDAAPENLTPGNPAWDGYPLVSPDGRTLYYLAMKRPGFEADRFAIMALDLDSGKRHEVAPQWDRSASALAISADGGTLYTTADEAGQHPLFAVRVSDGKVTRLSGEGTVHGFALDGRGGIIANWQDFTHPAGLYRLGPGESRVALTRFNDARLAALRFGKAEFFTFKGWNGEPVQGYVMTPVDHAPGRKYPVAFLIHGGPQGAWTNEFHYRWNPQTYAAAGFAVVAVNFHGSTGYGQAFTDAISGDWGGKPLTDLKLGWAAALKNYPFLDAKRACALGASYGGYMVYWMAGKWNTPWKCFVDHDGVFDSRSMYYSTEELWFDEWEHRGPEYEHPQNYEKFNPLRHVKDWRVPMLVIHGGLDFRIPDTQGLAAFTALQRRGIPSEFLYFPDENHWVVKPANSILWHDTVLNWMKRWTAEE